MKSLKLLLFFLVITLLVVAVVENIGFLMDQKTLRLDLWLWSGESPAVPLSVYFLAFLVIGLLLSYFCGLSERFKAKRTIQNHLETIRKQEKEIEVLKSLPIADETTPAEQSESV